MIRSRRVRRLTTPSLPVLIGEFEEDRLLVAGLQTPDSSEVILHGPRDSEASGTASPAGINPYFSKSSGSTTRKISPVLRSSGASTLALKPIEVGRRTHRHRRTELVVSTCRYFCWGCLRSACGGNEATVHQ